METIIYIYNQSNFREYVTGVPNTKWNSFISIFLTYWAYLFCDVVVNPTYWNKNEEKCKLEFCWHEKSMYIKAFSIKMVFVVIPNDKKK